jgi:hypothetical protein
MAMGGDLNALNTFPITWWTGHQAEESREGQSLDGHYPYARRVRLGWTRTGDGVWVHSSEDPKQWEVFCEQCGAREGPPDVQPEAAQKLRGPYSSKHRAEHVAKRHFDEMSPN